MRPGRCIENVMWTTVCLVLICLFSCKIQPELAGCYPSEIGHDHKHDKIILPACAGTAAGWAAAAPIPAKKPRSKTCRTPRSAWSSPVHQPPSTLDPNVCTPCLTNCPSQSRAVGPNDPKAPSNAAATTQAMSEDGPHAPHTPVQPSRPALDPILASRALATLNLINAVGKSAAQANGASNISNILRQKFMGNTMAASADQQ